MPLDANRLGTAQPWPWRVSNVRHATDPGKQPVCQVAHLIKQTFTDVVTASITKYISTGITSTNMPNAETKSYSKGDALWDGTLGTTGLPDYPRNVVITVTHGSSIVACNGVITGIDEYGKALTEDWAVTATGTTKTVTGLKAFYRVDSLTIISASNATANTLKMGTGVKLGLKFPAASIVPLGEMQDGALPTAGVIVAASTASTADARGTYASNAVPDSSKDYIVYYLSDDPTGI